VELPLYEPDTREKFRIVRDTLKRADYVILATNRLYRTIPRLPKRYPVSTEYYRLLFDGQFGFTQVKVFTSYPQLFGLQIVDDAADESFTVYDHPKPIIFKKERTLSDAEFDALLAEAFKVTPQVETPPTAKPQQEAKKTLLLEKPVESLPVVRGIGWNKLASGNSILAILLWWLLVELLGVLALPLTFSVFRHLRDRGYILTKTLAWLLVGFLNWWLSSLRLLPNTIPTLLLCVLALAAGSFLIARKRRVELIEFGRANWKLLLFNEAIFSIAFLFFCGVRILNPDLWQPWFGGEKPMEFAFVNAALRSPYFPPYDPYFAGGYINYYYYGQYLISVLIKLSGLIPSVGINLAIPTLFALTLSNVFCVGYNLATEERLRKMVGLAAAFFVVLMGNLTPVIQMIAGLLAIGNKTAPSPIPGVTALQQIVAAIIGVAKGALKLPAFDYWDKSTRVIAKTINEFPYFSFLFADIHPHMIDMTFTVLALALLLNLVLGGKRAENDDTLWERLLRFLMLPIVLGVLGPTNTWDLPTYLGIAFCAFLLQGFISTRRVQLVPAIARFAVVAVLSMAFYWPFHSHYQTISVGIGLTKDGSALPEMLAVWGFFLFVLSTGLLMQLFANRARTGVVRFWRVMLRNFAYLPDLLDHLAAFIARSARGYTLTQLSFWGVLLLSILLALLRQFTAALLLPLVAMAALALLRDDLEPEEQMTNLVSFTGLLILLGVEVVYLKDFLGGGDYRRMNTVFKFHMQSWVLLGIALGVGLPRLWAWVRGWRSTAWRTLWRVVFTILLASGALYPILATPARVLQRFPKGAPPIGTLDGLAYMTVGVYTWPDDKHPIELKYDYDAIQWLWENVPGTPVIAEGRIDYYREGGMRVSSFTGLPTLLGQHQGEQRYDWQVGERDRLAKDLFDSPDIARARQIITDLHIRYIYVGQLERYVYNAAGLQKFDQMVQQGLLTVAYENEKVRIYQAPS
jgi:YYY domain-containing protein